MATTILWRGTLFGICKVSIFINSNAGDLLLFEVQEQLAEHNRVA